MIHIISTKVRSGRGGISTAVNGLYQARALRDLGCNLIISHSNDQPKLSTLLAAVKSVLHDVEKGDVVWCHCGPWFSILRKVLLSILAKLRGAKIVLHFHSQTLDGYLKNSLGRRLIEVVIWWADGIVVLTPWWRNRILEVFPHLKPSKVGLCPNPLDDQLLALTQQEKVFSEGPNVKLLAMSRLVEGKGFEQAILSLVHLPASYNLTIAGDGPLLPLLQDLVSSHGLKDRVTFLGWVDYSLKLQCFIQHDLFLLPSKNDSFGMGFIEAMAAGLPVVALANQATPDVVPNNIAGILCNDDSPATLASACEQCIMSRQEMGKAGKQYVQEHYNKDIIAMNVIKFFETL